MTSVGEASGGEAVPDRHAGARSRFALLPALALGTAFVLVLPALHALRPDGGGAFVAVFPPDTADDAALRAVVAAGGTPKDRRTLSLLGWPAWVVEAAAPDFRAAVRAQGALIAIDAGLGTACLSDAKGA